MTVRYTWRQRMTEGGREGRQEEEEEEEEGIQGELVFSRILFPFTLLVIVSEVQMSTPSFTSSPRHFSPPFLPTLQQPHPSVFYLHSLLPSSSFLLPIHSTFIFTINAFLSPHPLSILPHGFSDFFSLSQPHPFD